MTTKDALRVAQQIVGEDASVHIYRSGRHEAIQVTGCDHDSGARLGRKIEEALFGPRDLQSDWCARTDSQVGFVDDAAFVAVWIS